MIYQMNMFEHIDKNHLALDIANTGEKYPISKFPQVMDMK